jgi:ribose transport system permease protein
VKTWGARLEKLLGGQQTGLIMVILLLGAALSLFAGSHTDPLTGRQVNNFLNLSTLVQTLTDASFFAIMAVGATIVIISGGIDLSVGSIYALSGVAMALLLRGNWVEPSIQVTLGIILSFSIGIGCGLLNGLMITALGLHPFIITLGTMWVFRGIAFVSSKAESILVPDSLTSVAKANLGVSPQIYPVPTLVMVAVAVAGTVFLARTVPGRYVYAVGANAEAARYAGLRIKRILVGVYALSGLVAGISAFLGSSYYGSASCGDATGYELYVIASAVVGGASLAGGKGNALNAMLGAILIVLIRQSIRTLHLDQNYEWIIIGCAIIVAVSVERFGTRLAARKLS